MGHIKLTKLQPHHLIGFYNNLAEENIRLDSYYAPTDAFCTLLNDSKEPYLAHKLGVSPKTLINLKAGGRVKHDTADKIRKYYDKSLKECFSPISKNNETLSYKTIKHHHDLISSILSTAVKWNLITRNPATAVTLPKVAKNKKLQYYDDGQVGELFRRLNDAPLKYKAIIYHVIDTGLRSVEVAGLEWSDLDFDTNSLIVKQQRQYVTGYGVLVKEPKTDTGNREITVSESVMKLLRQYKKEQYENKLKCGSMWHDNEYVFTHEDGKAMHPHRPYTFFTEFIKRNGLPEITFHALRHTNASILIAQGVDVVTLSSRLGHSDKNITLNTYSHVIKSKEKQAAEKMDSFYEKLL